ncbi:MAG TPA: hypothetical protein VNT54_15240, partial [Solirubrobacteraceae bacterium]|nr:hypothetical protein [Solirubrobacteraceae bacterium]
GAPYPLVSDSYDEAALAGASAADAPGATTAGGGTTADGGTTTPEPPRATSGGSRSVAGGGGTAAGSGGAKAASASSGARARGLLRVYAKKRVAASRRAVVLWRAKPMPHVRRWVVYLDGRRVRSVRARGSRTHRLSRRVSSVGRHRWRIVGRDARGRRAISAVRSFRVVRPR